MNDPQARDAFFRVHLWEAIATLRDEAPAVWGRMTARQMVEHLSWVFAVSTGQASVECPVPEEKRERYKAFLYDNTPMMREFRNPALAAGLPPLRHASLAEATAAFRSEVERFLDLCRDAPEATQTHPVFGPMAMEEWSRSHFKHAYHHLQQFGLVDGRPAS